MKFFELKFFTNVKDKLLLMILQFIKLMGILKKQVCFLIIILQFQLIVLVLPWNNF